MGQVIAVVVGETEAAARAGARAVVVEYEDLPAILDIDDAISSNSSYEEWGHSIESGNVDAMLMGVDAQGEHVLEGEARMGGQEHFYLEPNACIVIPGENDEIVTYSSTQVSAAL